MQLGNHADFKLSITKALGDQLAEELEKLTPAPLTETNIRLLPPTKGVYQLRRGSKLLYVGKAEVTLSQRLGKHLRKLSGREGIRLEEITFTALSVDEDFSAVAPEKLLINRFQGAGEAPWNENGFGINDPGDKRDTTVFADNHFDQLYPARLDWIIDGLPLGTQNLRTLLKIAKDALPYTFRYAYYRKAKENIYEQFEVEISKPQMTAGDFFQFVSGSLPEPWQIMALPGYVVMYPRELRSESARHYYVAGEMVLAEDMSGGADSPPVST
ncbi:GIY-YIG nuclease family protein [Streptomyces profundus]|uniref:GIY-YIG nuclease family protein n=1 Tax=Streptomyces profundus TaxID=2867410 RepID=UPI001D16C997|nr:GIY-YIG nuclease family protein [Streptomyces sp. MA3_2.13]UED84776.1 GIY-YIG nuclease family protein [Streptomyces sp. MA3_2.13]